MKIAIDAMGGDHAPQAIVEGVVHAAKKTTGNCVCFIRRQ
ncbi:fatty acid/phospholipid synthesis protein [Brochothrix campestris FSL F6-1037]|uniref:Fatty acid/phospholipid synthesis protein n=1 Tax=Brochothrix campestris FSL F6-1037 TaxID=1265861 RepID=W7CYM9_9LIST|nr:fatty acid/phospholipid synthesis protein [Brochothrix campestris FSL F6-1037]